MFFKVKRKTQWEDFWSEELSHQGVVTKPVTKIKLTFLGVPIKTLYQYAKQYSGEVVDVDKTGNPIYTIKTREKFIKSKIKHAQTRDFVIGNLRRIVKDSDDDKAKKVAKSILKELKSNKEYSISIE